MKLLLLIALAMLCARVNASVIPINPVTTTYAVTGTPVITAHSHQVVARHFNRVYVPTVSTVPAIATAGVTYPGYSTTWGTYPYAYRPSYGYSYGYGYGYPYGYTYPYGTSVW